MIVLCGVEGMDAESGCCAFDQLQPQRQFRPRKNMVVELMW